MNIRYEILQILSDPTTAYLVLVSGFALVIIEFLRPGWVVPGVSGAVAITLAFHALVQTNWTSTGGALLLASLLVAFTAVRRSSYVGPALSGGAFFLGSVILVQGADNIHPVAALIGGVAAFSCAWLLQIAYRARTAKCHC
jgi:membrane-bound serine protease (ClpP class)